MIILNDVRLWFFKKRKLCDIQEKSKETCERKIEEIFRMEELVYSQDFNYLATFG